MTEPRTGPVTYGQLSVLRSLESYGSAGQTVANLVNVWPVPPGAEVAQAMDAWLQLVRTHESLRTTYQSQTDGFIQTVHPFRSGRIPVTELADDAWPTALQAAMNLKAETFDISADLPWRAMVATCQGEPTYLITIVHHVAADYGALTVLRQQFSRLLDAQDPGPQVQPLDLAHAQRDHPRQAAQARAHLVKTWPEFLPEDRRTDDTTPRRRATVYSTPALDAARSLSGELRVSVQSLVLAASVLVLTRLQQKRGMTLALMAANRLDQRWSSLVSSLNQCAPVTVAVDEGAELGDFLRGTYYQSLVAYQHGCYDVDALRHDLAEAGVPEPDPTFFAQHFNFLGDAESEPDPGSPVRTAVQWRDSTQRSGPNLHVPIAVGNGLFIGVGASEDCLPGDLPARAAAAIEAALVNMPGRTAAPLREISTQAIRNI
jgi:hypothetical protein